ncbi:MAG: hypothetical protein Q4P06_02095 [Actinomycetaceae bacterium]|nr:hypothetical protein [Actinomycetaceae bacterium]
MRSVARLAWLLERSRFSSSRGTSWLDVLAVFGFAVATAILLLLSGASSLFIRRADQAGSVLSPPVVQALDSPQLGSAFFSSYQAVFAFAFLVTIPPALSLAASAASSAARSRLEQLRLLRLFGLGRARGWLLVLVVVFSQFAAGVAAGTLLYFTSFYLWQLLEIQGTVVSATEVMISSASWLNTVFLLAVATAGAALVVLSFSSLDSSRNRGAGEFRFFAPFPLLVSLLVVALSALVEAVLSAEGFVGDLTALVAAVTAVVVFVGPGLLYVLGRFLLRSSRLDLTLAGASLSSRSRALFVTASPAALVMFMALSLGAQPQEFLSAIAQTDGVDLPQSQVPVFIAELLRRNLVVGLLLVCVAVVLLSLVSVSLDHAGGIIYRRDQAQTLFLLGVDPTLLHRARLWQLLCAQFSAFALAVVCAAAVVLPDTSVTELSWEPLFLVFVVFAVTVVASLVANRWLAPLQDQVLTGDSRSRLL